MIGAESLLRTLVDNGVDVCFMNPGTSEMQFVAALDRVPEMRGVLCLFEGVCSGAADGYARMSGKTAATLLHLGPGLANALANFHNARKARSPIVSIVGEHSTQHLRFDAPLTADVGAFARAVSDDVYRVNSAAEMATASAAVIAAATRPPGQTAMLIVPADFSWSEAGEPAGVVQRAARRVPDAECIREAAALLREFGDRAGVLLSGSALLEPGPAAAARIRSTTGARIFADRNAARTASGRGRFHPQRIAYFPEKAEAQLDGLQHLLLVEAKAPVSFFGYPGRRSTLAPEDCTMHVIASLEEDGRTAVEALSEELGGTPAPIVADDWPLPPRGELLTLGAMGRSIASLLPENAVVCDEMVSSAEPVWPWLLRAAPHDYLPLAGGAIGLGMPLGIGAAVACPDRKVVVLEADGSGMYTLQALWTMARERLDITVVIFANRRYRILDIEMQRTGAKGFAERANDMIDIGRPDLDWLKLAAGMGVDAVRAADSEAFHARFAAAMRGSGPLLIEAVL